MKEVSVEQRARARHLDSKTGTLAGFAATVLTLDATLGHPLLNAHLPGDSERIVKICFVGSIAALTFAAIVAVVGVLRPMSHQDLDDAQIDAYSDRPKVTTDPSDLRMTWLRTVTVMTISDRRAGTRKSRLANAAAILLGIGLVGVAGQAITLAFSR